jgi:hypothetical protein
MKSFHAAMPEIPVSLVDKACNYYKNRLGFTTDDMFRSHYGNKRGR